MLPVVYSANLTIIFESTTRFSAFVKTAFEYRCRLQHHGEIVHDGVGDDVRVVGGLVGVAVEAGGEDQGGDAGPVEDNLVGELVEELGEVLAAVEGVVDVQADVVVAVAHVDDAAVLFSQGLLAEDYHEVSIGLVYRLYDCAYLVDVDGAEDAVGHFSLLQPADKGLGAGHVELLGIEGGEDDVLVRAGSGLFHGAEHVGEVEQDGHSGCVVVGAVVDVAVEDAEVVVVGRYEHVFIRRYGAAYYPDHIAPAGAAQAVGDERLEETAAEEWLQTVLPEHVSNCPGNSLAAYSSCCPSLIHVISQPFHDAHLFGWIDDLLVHCVWAQRTFALLCL